MSHSPALHALHALPTSAAPRWPGLPALLFALGAAALAMEPARWLVTTWRDPAWDGGGGLLALGVAGLAAWSLSSPRVRPAGGRRFALGILFATALLRLLGRILAVHALGAGALALDVYALARLAGLDARARAVSPAWLAALSLLTLPLERMAQRAMGFPLQLMAARLACGTLALLGFDAHAAGTHVVLAGRHCLVDLPCSGARGVLLGVAALCGLAAILRPTAPRAAAGLATATGLVAAFGGALLGNAARIAVLAVASGLPWSLLVDVAAQPWHELIGAFALALGLGPLVLWALSVPDAQVRAPQELAASDSTPRRAMRLPAVALFAALVAVAVAAPAHPVDVGRALPLPSMPSSLLGRAREDVELTPRELDYFTRYGGSARKAHYGELSVLLVSTSAPLRHLHAPDECLRGAGLDVRAAGQAGGPLPSATYRVRDAAGSSSVVRISYVSARGAVTTSVAEACWSFLRSPCAWTSVERSGPEGLPASAWTAIDSALAHELDLPDAGSVPHGD